MTESEAASSKLYELHEDHWKILQGFRCLRRQIYFNFQKEPPTCKGKNGWEGNESGQNEKV